MRQRLWLAIAASVIGLSHGVAAQTDGAASPDQRAARRFPQAVRVGDLIGRQVLQPTEAQHVLGRVAAVVRGGDGRVAMVIRTGGVLGIGTRLVAVPIVAIALLGEFVALMDVTPEQLATLPATAPAPPLGPDEIIRVGLVRPFH